MARRIEGIEQFRPWFAALEANKPGFAELLFGYVPRKELTVRNPHNCFTCTIEKMHVGRWMVLAVHSNVHSMAKP